MILKMDVYGGTCLQSFPLGRPYIGIIVNGLKMEPRITLIKV